MITNHDANILATSVINFVLLNAVLTQSNCYFGEIGLMNYLIFLAQHFLSEQTLLSVFFV